MRSVPNVTCGICWFMFIIKRKKKRLDFFVSFYIGTVPAIGILFKDLNLLFKNISCQVLLKDKSPLPCSPRGFG